MARMPGYALLGAVAAVLAAALVRTVAYLPGGRWLDAAVLHGFTGLDRPRTHGLANAIAHICDPKPFALIGLALVAIAILRARPRLALAVPVILLAANVTTQILKPALAAPRFSAWLGLGQIANASWPSGHATAAMSLALCAVLVAGPRWRPVAAAAGGLFSIAVTYSFLALGWHYPSDVLGGFLVAAAWTLVVVAALAWAERRWPARGGASGGLRVRDAVAPSVVGAGVSLGLVIAVALLRPAAVVSYAQEHTAFVAGAAGIAALGMALATGLAVALRR